MKLYKTSLMLLTVFLVAENPLLGQIRVVKPSVVKKKDDDEKETKPDKSDDKEKDPLAAKGMLEKIAAPTGKLVELKWKDGEIKAEFKSTQNEIYQVINEMQRIAGYGGGSSSSSGSGGWSYRFNGQQISGEYLAKNQGKDDQETSLKLEEISGMQRTLFVSGGPNGFKLVINGGTSPYFLRIKQLQSKQVIVQEIAGVEINSFQAESFASLVRNHVDFTENRLFPALKRFGLGDLMTPYSDQVRLHVLSTISPLTDQETGQLKELVAKLDAGTFKEREKAMDELKIAYEKNKELFTRAMNDNRYSPEVRKRIRTIVEKQSKAATTTVLRLANKSKLVDDVDYLAWLVQLQPPGTVRDKIIQRLKELGVNAFAEGVESGQSWLAGRAMTSFTAGQLNVDESGSASDPLKEKGELEKVSKGFGSLVRLKWNEDNLIIDRDHWKARFDGKSIEELSKQVETEIADRKLPKQWYRAGGTQGLKKSGYPQVLFECWETEVNLATAGTHRYVSSGMQTKGRMFDGTKIQASLTIEGESGGRRIINRPRDAKKKKMPDFQIMVKEKTGPQRQLTLTENQPGKLNMSYSSEESNLIMRLVGDNENGWIIQDVQGNQVFAAQAPTVKKLIEENPKYFGEKFFPLFAKAGMQFDPVIYSPVAVDPADADKAEKK